MDKQKRDELINEVSLLSVFVIRLIANKNVIVRHEYVDGVVNLGSFFGLVVHGGSFIGENEQCLYIE